MQKRGEIEHKAQAALEFLITYGWAVLAVLAIIGGLYYSGILSFSDILPEKCYISPGIECMDYSVSASKVALVLRNTIGEDMTIEKIGIIKVDGDSCSNSQTISLRDDEKKIVTISCSSGSDGATLKADIEITYRLQGDAHIMAGNIRAKIIEGSTTTSITTCQNAENDGLCDGLDVLFGEGYKSACCGEHGLCC